MTKDHSSSILKLHGFLWALGTFVLGCGIAPLYQWKVNPDAFSYIHLAQALLRHDAAHAVSPYWSPLFAWLLALPMSLGLQPLLAARMLQAFFAGILVWFGYAVLREWDVSPFVRRAALVALALTGLMFGMSVVSPDLLLTDIFLWQFLLVIRPSFFRSARQPILLGALAGFAFLTKTAALPYFILALIATGVCARIVSDVAWRHIMRSTVISIVVAGVLALPWVVVVSSLAGKPTMGLSAEVIYASQGPHGEGLPILSQGLFEPPLGSMSIWDAPHLMPRHTWSPFASTSSLRHQAILVFENFGDAVRAFTTLSTLGIAAFLGAIVLAFRSGKERHRLPAAIVVTHTLLMVGLYLPILIDPRYLWYPHVLLLLVGASLVSQMIVSIDSRWPGRMLLAGFGLAFVLPASITLALDARDGAKFAQTAEIQASRYVLAEKRLAADNWKAGLSYAWFAKALYLGKPKDGATDAQLMEKRIDAYLVWGAAPDLSHFRLATASGERPAVYLRR